MLDRLKEFAAFLISIGCAYGAVSIPDEWRWINPLPQGHGLRALGTDGETIVAVGEWGIVLSSTDGLQWRSQTFPSDQGLLSVAHGAGTWVVVGPKGLVFSSSNLNSWEQHDLRLQSDLFRVRYGNGRFLTWTVGGLGFVSENGRDWIFQEMPGRNIHEVLMTNGLYLALSDYCYASRDGRKWELLEGGPNRAVTYDGERYYGASRGNVSRSYHGSLWEQNPSTMAFHKLIPSNSGVFGFNYGARTVHLTRNGLDYSPLSNSLPYLEDIVFYKDRFIGVNGGGDLFSSVDAVSWATNTMDLLPLTEVGWNLFLDEEQRLYGSSDLKILTSQNLNDWVEVGKAPAESRFKDVARGKGKYVALVGPPTGPIQVAWSVNGTEWHPSQVSGPFSGVFGGVEFGNDRFVLAGPNGRISLSQDGISWSELPPISEHDLALSFNANKFVALGFRWGATGWPIPEEFGTSTNGVEWQFQLVQRSLTNLGPPLPFSTGYFAGGVMTHTGQNDGLYWISEDFHRIKRLPFKGHVTQVREWRNTLLITYGRNILQSGPLLVVDVRPRATLLEMDFQGLIPGKAYGVESASRIGGPFTLKKSFRAESDSYQWQLPLPEENEFFQLKPMQ